MRAYWKHYVIALLPLTGCPPAPAGNVRDTQRNFLNEVPCQSVAEAALLHIIQSPYSLTSEKLEAAKALAEIEKVRIAAEQRRRLEVESPR